MKLVFLFMLWCLGVCPVGAEGVEILRDVPSTYVYPVSGFLPFNLHRGTNALLSLMLHGATFEDPQGVACAALKVDHDPKDPRQGLVVTIVGVNSGAGEIIYNVGLKDLRRLGETGSGKGQFLHPQGVAIDGDGDVAVADTGNDRIVLLKHDGLRLRWVRTWGQTGSGPGNLKSPTAVAYDSQDNLYIADSGNDRIQVLDGQGHFHSLPIHGLRTPSALAVIDGKETWVDHHEGEWANRLAVIDHGGTRVQTFTLEGRPLRQVDAQTLADPPAKLHSCAFDYYGDLIVTDSAKGCLRKFDPDLKPLTTFGSAGTGDFQFNDPRGIAFNRQFGQMLVAEKDSVQYFWNGADALNLTAVFDKPQEQFHFFLTEKALVTATIERADGTVVKELAKDQVMDAGAGAIAWTPTPSDLAGTYQLRLKVMATYSSRERIAKEQVLPFSDAP